MAEWLLLDVSYLAFRAYYAIPGLTFGEIGTSVPFGILRDIQLLSDQFSTTNICYCFDLGPSLRKTMFPGYKASRQPDEAMLEVKKQLYLFHNQLVALNIKNLYRRRGFEADDMIAGLVYGFRSNKQSKASCIIVSADKDLYQLLNDRTIIYNPAKKAAYDLGSFRKEWGVEPKDWPRVKAIAGCNTDDIPGVVGVAEKTAARYIDWLNKGTLHNLSPAKKQKITNWICGEQYRFNLKLVTLPLDKRRVCKPVCEITPKDSWNWLANHLGMKSLVRS